MGTSYVRVNIYGDLAQQLKEHVEREWSSARGAQTLVVKRALKEYLEREEHILPAAGGRRT